jgi:hypothetical protein
MLVAHGMTAFEIRAGVNWFPSLELSPRGAQGLTAEGLNARDMTSRDPP